MQDARITSLVKKVETVCYLDLVTGFSPFNENDHRTLCDFLIVASLFALLL